jgi:hypothetical protein
MADKSSPEAPGSDCTFELAGINYLKSHPTNGLRAEDRTTQAVEMVQARHRNRPRQKPSRLFLKAVYDSSDSELIAKGPALP